MSKQWHKVRLGEVVSDLTEERTFQVADEDDILDPTIASATHRISVGGQSKGFEIKVRKRVKIEPGDLVFSRLHTQNGAFAYAKQRFQATGTFIPLAVNEAKTERRFLFWALDQFVPSLSASDTVGRETFKTEDILSLEIPLPPLAEQRRVVARIEELAAQIHEARTFRHQAAIQSDSIVESAAQAILTALSQRTLLGDGLFKLIYRYPTFYGIEFTDSGVGLLKIGHLSQESWTINFEKQPCFISHETSERFPRTILKEDDLVMAVRGATIGKTAHVTSKHSGFNINPNLLRLQPNPAKLVGKFFWYYMRSPFGAEQFEALVTSTAKETITIPKLKSLFVPLPSLGEQRRIVAELDALQTEVNALKRLQGETASELDALLPSILDKAFKGEL